MINLNNQIEEVIQAIEQTTNLFYQQKNPEGYQLLDQTLNQLMQTINLIFAAKSEMNQIAIDEQHLNSVLENAMAAIENGDTILLSDIFIFDVKNILEECLHKL